MGDLVLVRAAAPDDPGVRGTLAALWPAVRTAADKAADSLGRDGLPPAAPDYRETRTEPADPRHRRAAARRACAAPPTWPAAPARPPRPGAGRAPPSVSPEPVRKRFGTHGYNRTPSEQSECRRGRGVGWARRSPRRTPG
ncbi:hypothetical protein ACU686_04840 [Yinghuangia aomiensis]